MFNAKIMANYQKLKPAIILIESPLVKYANTVKFSVISKGNGIDT